MLVQTSLAQNNTIFAGGIADGFSLSCFEQASGNLIFSGGIADGYDEACFLQAANNALFAGGRADGFSENCFLQASQNAIFAGASGDGYDEGCFVMPSQNDIFAGGIADGFNEDCFVMPSGNGIYAGGFADGFVEACFYQAGNNLIYAGGNADGFVEACFYQPSNNFIYAGGIADGFHCAQFLYSPVFTVELLSFDGIYDQGDAWLAWATETEINNSHFELERSLDGDIFEWVTTVPGAGNTTEIQTYEYRDPVAHLASAYPLLYYRLKQVDFDGVFQYTNTVTITLKASKNLIRAFPNPASHTLFIRFPFSVNHPVTIELFDFHGKEIRKKTFPPDPSNNLIQLDVEDLPEGAYYLRVESGNLTDDINTLIISILR
jgi:hypothetical protein